MISSMLSRAGMRIIHLDREELICDSATVLIDCLDRDHRNNAEMSSSYCREVKYLSTNSHEYVVRAVLHVMRLELSRAVDVFRRADDVTHDRNDEDGATANEPNNDVQRKLLAPRLTDIWALHPAKPCQERRRYPEGENPTQRNPATASRAFLEDLRCLAFLNLTGQHLFVDQSLAIVVPKHVPRGCIRLAAVRRRVVGLAGETGTGIEIVAPDRLVIVIILILRGTFKRRGVGDQRKRLI